MLELGDWRFLIFVLVFGIQRPLEEPKEFDFSDVINIVNEDVVVW